MSMSGILALSEDKDDEEEGAGALVVEEVVVEEDAAAEDVLEVELVEVTSFEVVPKVAVLGPVAIAVPVGHVTQSLVRV